MYGHLISSSMTFYMGSAFLHNPLVLIRPQIMSIFLSFIPSFRPSFLLKVSVNQNKTKSKERSTKSRFLILCHSLANWHFFNCSKTMCMHFSILVAFFLIKPKVVYQFKSTYPYRIIPSDISFES